MKNNIAEEKKLEIVFEEIVEDNTMISAIRETDGTEKLRITWIEKQKRENIMRNYELPFKTLAKTEDKITGITTLYGYNNKLPYLKSLYKVKLKEPNVTVGECSTYKLDKFFNVSFEK